MTAALPHQPVAPAMLGRVKRVVDEEFSRWCRIRFQYVRPGADLNIPIVVSAADDSDQPTAFLLRLRGDTASFHILVDCTERSVRAIRFATTRHYTDRDVEVWTACTAFLVNHGFISPSSLV